VTLRKRIERLEQAVPSPTTPQEDALPLDLARELFGREVVDEALLLLAECGGLVVWEEEEEAARIDADEDAIQAAVA
jgi:hypothetical protein